MLKEALTFNEIISHENIQKLLEDYAEVKSNKDWKRIPRNTCIRFFRKEKDKWKFHMGGILLKKCLEENYVTLTNFRKKFRIEIDKCKIFAKKKVDTRQYEQNIAELNEEIQMWGEEYCNNDVLETILPKVKYDDTCDLVIDIKKKFPDELKWAFHVQKENLQIGSYLYYVARDLSGISNLGRITSIQKRNGEVYSVMLVNALSTKGIGGKWKICCDKYYMFRLIPDHMNFFLDEQ